MTPRRYLSTATNGLTLDNRNLPEHAEGQQDEIRALREALREAKTEIETLKSQIFSLKNQAFPVKPFPS